MAFSFLVLTDSGSEYKMGTAFLARKTHVKGSIFLDFLTNNHVILSVCKNGICPDTVLAENPQLEYTEAGFLKLNSESGALDAAPIHWKAGDSIPNHIIREYHRINIEIAARALEKLPSEQRDFATMSFIGNPEQIAMAQKELRAVHERIVSIMAVKKDGPQEVFRFSSCLFPVRNFK